MFRYYLSNKNVNKEIIDNALFVVFLFVKFSISSLAGGIKDFTHQDSEKWILNRPFQVRMVDSLLSLAENGKTANNLRSNLRAKEIRKSEERVMKVVEALNEDFFNPFGSGLVNCYMDNKLKQFVHINSQGIF